MDNPIREFMDDPSREVDFEHSRPGFVEMKQWADWADTLLNEREQAETKCMELARLLLESRDALPAISFISARLHNVDLSLASRIESALEPWRVKDDPPTKGGG